MKALTGNFALLSVNLLIRCIQTILPWWCTELQAALELSA